MSKVTGDEIAEAMVGRKLIEVKNEYQTAIRSTYFWCNKFTVKNSNPKVFGLETLINVKPGEIVAVAGVEGNGQKN